MMAASSSDIPVVDFTALSVDLTDSEVNTDSVQKLSREICQAFNTVGFVYLKNTGISDQQVEHVRQCTGRFFSLPGDVKKQYARRDDDNNGWVCLERESLNPDRPGDLKEAYNVYKPICAKVWPEKEVPGFKATVLDFRTQCSLLSSRVLRTMAISLNLEDPDFFKKAHDFEEGISTLRCLYYPKLDPSIGVKPNQVRCGEHSDYGSMTLLFQDDIGGLEVMHKSGVYVPATPIPGTVVVNVGDLMQRWTTDRLIATKHRVLIPETDSGRQVRQSLAYFVHPDQDFLVECLDGSDKYQPVTGAGYLQMRFAATY